MSLLYTGTYKHINACNSTTSKA